MKPDPTRSSQGAAFPVANVGYFNVQLHGNMLRIDFMPDVHNERAKRWPRQYVPVATIDTSYLDEEVSEEMEADASDNALLLTIDGTDGDPLCYIYFDQPNVIRVVTDQQGVLFHTNEE